MESSLMPCPAPVKDIETPVFLSDVSVKDAQWDKHRAATQTVGTLYGITSKYSKLANRMASCSTFLLFAKQQPEAIQKWRLKNAFFCKVRHCPVCQWRRAVRNTRRVFERLPLLEDQLPEVRWLFLTLTVKNPPMAELRETLKRMNQAWQRLSQRDEWPAVGWLRAVEVTKGQDGNPHPHFHVMLAVKPSYYHKRYIKQQRWLELWREAMRDDTITQVDIRTVKDKTGQGDLKAAIVETLKYAYKPEDTFNDSAFLYGLTEQLHKMRFLASGGILKGILKEDLSNAEMLAGDELKESADTGEVMLAKWNRSVKRYHLVSDRTADYQQGIAAAKKKLSRTR
ncbi:MAG: protein rep [Methylococcus sp.]